MLKSYNGTSFTYDQIGNPITYYNGSSYTFRWIQGRKLIDGTKGSTSFSYSYNSDGLRTTKRIGNQTYTYYWNGTQLAAMTVSSSGTVTVTMQFFYNAEGTPLYFTYNGTEYFYVTNLQGDVMGIANGNGIVGYYEYDAWGKILSYSGISSTDYSAITYNPLRYRGYIYDNETGFYYLQSRYYDPAIRRFINADGYVSTGQNFTGYNMFAYCNNNPIMYTDSTGNFGFLISAAIVLVGGLVSAGMSALTAATTGGDVWESAAEGFVHGSWSTFCSLILGPAAAPIVAGIGSSAFDVSTQLVGQYRENGSISLGKVDLFQTFKAGAFSAVGAKIPALKDANGAKLVFNTALVWAESSMLFGSADMIIENIRDRKSKEARETEDLRLSNRSMLYHKINSTMMIA